MTVTAIMTQIFDIPREVLMPLTSLNPGNSRGLATRVKLVEAVLLKVTRLNNSDLPHSSRILYLLSQVLVQSLKGIDHLNIQCAW